MDILINKLEMNMEDIYYKLDAIIERANASINILLE